MSEGMNDVGSIRPAFPKVAIIILNWNDVLKFIEVIIQILEPFSERIIVCKLLTEHSDYSKRVFEKIYELSKK